MRRSLRAPFSVHMSPHMHVLKAFLVHAEE